MPTPITHLCFYSKSDMTFRLHCQWATDTKDPKTAPSRTATVINFFFKLEKPLDPNGSRIMTPPGLQISGLVRPWPLTLCIPVVITQWAFTVTCPCQVWLKLVVQFLRYLAIKDLLWHISASYDLALWSADPQSWPFRALAPGPFVPTGIEIS